MAYQTIPPSNSGSQDSATATWVSNVAAFVASKDATITRTRWVGSFADVSCIDRPAVGSSGSAYLYQFPGASFGLRLDSGATISSSATTRNRTQAVAAGASVYDNLVTNARTSHWAMACQVIINAVTATCDLYPLALSDEATQTVYFGVNGATSQTFFTLKIGSAAVQVTTDPVGTLGSTVNTLIMVCDGTTLSAYVNYNSTASVSGASNTAANAAAHAIFYAANGATAANASHTILRAVVMGAV